jgi:hypothetical protein
MALHPSFVGPRRRARVARSLFAGALLTLPLWLACADPDGKFDDFVKRTRMTDTPERDAGLPPFDPDAGLFSAEQVAGTYLSVTSTPIRTLPVVYLIDVTAKQLADGLELTIVDQPLAYWDRRTPVGPKSAPRKLVVGFSGSYTEMLKGVVTPADANPITFMDSTSDTTFVGNLGGAEVDPASGLVTFWCGTVKGHVYPPSELDFEGDFSFTRITDVKAPYPAAVIGCAKTPADPAPEKQ